MTRIRVLFVAGLEPVARGGIGGQLVEARTLLASRFSEVMDVIPLSSTTRSIPPPRLPVRIADAACRLTQFLLHLARVDAVLIFATSGPSLLEKGLMCILARLAGRGVVVRLMSGFFPQECEKSRFVRLWVRLVLKSAHVIGAAGSTWERFFAGFPEAQGKTMVLPNAVAMPVKFSYSRQKQCQNRLLYVGWVDRLKGVFEALEVLNRVRAGHPECTLTVAGGGKDLEEFRLAVRSFGLEQNVRVLGWVTRDEVESLLAQADVFLFPSHFECMPNALIEAMAAGVAVVSTKVGAVEDLVIDGQNGFLVEVGDVGAMARCVSLLLGDPSLRQRFGGFGSVEARRRHDAECVWMVYARALQTAYRKAGGQADVVQTESEHMEAAAEMTAAVQPGPIPSPSERDKFIDEI